MPAWNEARRAGQRSRTKAQAERAAGASDTKVAIPMAAKRWQEGVCVYCASNRKLRVGRLAISGNVYFCADHVKQYEDDKAWEEKYKKEMGL
jgi:hypothetical protein